MNKRLATAQWADPALAEEKYLYRDGSVWLGRSASENAVPLGYNDDRHICLVSGSRGGKGTCSIINNLSLWPGSLVVLDPKGENATVIVARRGPGSHEIEGMEQALHVLDPFKAAEVDESCRSRFNPLDALNPEDEESVDEAGRIADAIVIIHEGNDPFWDESGRALVKGLILHVLTDPAYEGRRNLITLRKLITRGDWEAVEALRQMGEQDIPSGQNLLWMGVARNPVFDGLVAGIGDTFVSMMKSSPEQFESVLQVANRNTEFIDSPAMQRCLEASDFALSELKTRREGMSLFLCLPQRFMNMHYRWLRMMIGLTVTEMEKVKGQPASGHPVLLLLDEFAGLKRMETIENAVAQMAGYGVKMFFVLQSLEQLKAVYKDNWETFLANSGLKLFFNLEDHFSRDYVSKLIGDTEIILEVHSTGENESESESDSKSKSRSRSESTGDSTSHGHSVSEGTSSSSGWSESHGTNRSTSAGTGGSYSSSWRPGDFLSKSYSVGTTMSGSTSQGVSEGRSRSGTQGTSHGASDSTTRGTSRTSGSSESETSGTTHGTSRGQTSGTSETIHRRPLVSPDEIGLMFARVDDRDRMAYPGLGLAVIAGQAAIAFRRVNYYEDLQFIGRFGPHSEHPFPAGSIYTIDLQALAAYKAQLPGVSDVTWRPIVDPGAIVRAGDCLGHALAVEGGIPRPVANIRAARSGRVWMSRNARATPELNKYSILFYDDSPWVNPFGELDFYCTEVARKAEERRKADEEQRAREEMASRQAAQQGRAERTLEIRERRRTWARLAGGAGAVLVVDILIAMTTHSTAGIVIGIAAIGLLGVCGVKVSQTLADDAANVEPPEKPLAMDKFPLFQANIKVDDLQAFIKNSAKKEPPEKPLTIENPPFDVKSAMEIFEKSAKDRTVEDPPEKQPAMTKNPLLQYMLTKEQMEKIMKDWEKKKE